MKIEFAHDGHTYRLNTDSGEVQCREIEQPSEPQPQQQPQQLAPSGDRE